MPAEVLSRGCLAASVARHSRVLLPSQRVRHLRSRLAGVGPSIEAVLLAVDATLRARVKHVVARRPNEEMSRVDALRRVATVADVEAVGNRTVRQLVRVSVSGMADVVHLELPVALPAARPEPALILRTDIDVVPEPCDLGHRSIRLPRPCRRRIAGLSPSLVVFRTPATTVARRAVAVGNRANIHWGTIP